MGDLTMVKKIQGKIVGYKVVSKEEPAVVAEVVHMH